MLAWLVLIATQPIVWVLLAAAAIVDIPLSLITRPFSWLGTKKKSISGRHVLITGGSEGIGLELALVCASKGAHVSLLARTRTKLEAARAQILAAVPDAKVAVCPADVSRWTALAEAVKQASQELGPIDICIAAAGASTPKYFEDLTEDDFMHMLNVNYLGVVNVARVVLPGMVARGSGQFAAVSSMAAAVPFVGYAAYAPTKAATRTFVDVLRNEYADTPLQFHLAFPPDTDTPGFAKENASKPYETSHIWPEMFNETFPAKDVATQIVDGMLTGKYFLTSPDAFGNLLVSRAWGHLPRASPLFEAAIAPIFVGLHCVMVWMADRAVIKGKHHAAALAKAKLSK